MQALLAELIGHLLTVAGITASGTILLIIVAAVVWAFWRGPFKKKPEVKSEQPAQSEDPGLAEAARQVVEELSSETAALEPIPEPECVLCGFTQEELLTATQAISGEEREIFISQCVGTWIWVDGSVRKIDMSRIPNGVAVTLYINHQTCLLLFYGEHWRERFFTLAPGDPVIAMGKIRNLHLDPPALLALEDCTMSRHLKI